MAVIEDFFLVVYTEDLKIASLLNGLHIIRADFSNAVVWMISGFSSNYKKYQAFLQFSSSLSQELQQLILQQTHSGFSFFFLISQCLYYPIYNMNVCWLNSFALKIIACVSTLKITIFWKIMEKYWKCTYWIIQFFSAFHILSILSRDLLEQWHLSSEKTLFIKMIKYRLSVRL